MFSVAARASDLSAQDVGQIKAICHALIGVLHVDESDSTFARLAPYVASPTALRELHVVCDTRCGGLVVLRGDADVYFSTPAPHQHSGDTVPAIDTVVFHHHGKVLLQLGNDGGP